MRTLNVMGMLVMALLLFLGCGSLVEEGEIDMPIGYVRASLDAQSNGIGLADLDTDEALPRGPAGIFKTNGGYVILDNVRRKVHVLNKNLSLIESIDVSANARGLISAVQDDVDIVFLDAAAFQPSLVRMDERGQFSTSIIQSDEKTPPSGLQKDDVGLIVEYEGGDYLYRVFDKRGGVLEKVDGYIWNGHHFAIARSEDMFGHVRHVLIDGKPVRITVPNMLGAIKLMGTNLNGDVIVLVENVQFLPEVSVDQTVWVIGLDGVIRSIAKTPLERNDVGQSFGLTVGHDGNSLALTTHRDGVRLWGLQPVNPTVVLERLPADEIGDDDVGATTQRLYVAGNGCLTSSQMLSNINEYGNVSTYLSLSNINNNGSCTSREAPSYLGSAGYYSSVSYDWGGFDTPAGFVSAMSSGGKAGNMNTSYALSCSYGIDCSGFVSRVWGFTFKLSTSTIPSYSSAAYGPAYELGEVFNKPNDHVMIFAGNAYNGIFAYESTALNNYDRVVYTYRTWSELSGYSARRSNTMCN